MNTVLDVTSGICWSFVYIVAIILGIKNQTWCLPKLAICQNFSWELWIVSLRIFYGWTSGTGFIIQFIWLTLDFGVLIIWLYFDRHRKRQTIKNIGLLALIAAIMYFCAYYMSQWEMMAFLINAIMSATFIIRTYKDESRWKSRLVAYAKMAGTLPATILNGLIIYNPYILWLGGVCLILDIYYILLLTTTKKEAFL